MGEKKRADFFVDVDDFYLEVMGHDINNLNQVILANLELLQESNRLEEIQNQFLEEAILATKDCSITVKNVRALQKISAGTREFLDIDICQAIRECIREMSRPADKKVTIRYTPLQKGPIVKAMTELKLAFFNVIANAIKYSGPRVRIDIAVGETTVDDRKCYATTITDDGNGIPDKIKQIFSGKPRQNANALHGKGLGLYTAKALAEAPGGSLKVEDRVPGDYTKGTKVTITLPAAEGT